MTEKLHEFVEKLRSENTAWVTKVIEGYGEVTVITSRESIVDIQATSLATARALAR